MCYAFRVQALAAIADPTRRELLALLSASARRVRRLPDRACALAVLSMTTSFAAGDLVGGIVNGLRQLSDQAGHPATLRHPH